MTTDRDTELDELTKALRAAPHIEKPDELEPEVGAFCFMQAHRICGPQCAAYAGDAPTPPERCTIIGALALLPELIQLARAPRPQRAGAPVITPPDPYGGRNPL